MVSSGYRAIPRAAGLVVEAWGDSREECLAEAVRAVVDSFAEIGDAVPDGSVEFALAARDDDALLLTVLDEVIDQIQGEERVPVDVSIDEGTGIAMGEFEIRLATVPLEAVREVGALPEAVQPAGSWFRRESGVWRAHALIEV